MPLNSKDNHATALRNRDSNSTTREIKQKLLLLSLLFFSLFKCGHDVAVGAAAVAVVFAAVVATELLQLLLQLVLAPLLLQTTTT